MYDKHIKLAYYTSHIVTGHLVSTLTVLLIDRIPANTTSS